MTFRLFIIDDEDGLRRVPLKRFERLLLRHDSSEKFPEYAGQRMRYAFVTLEVEGRKPLNIERIDYAILQFDSEGKLDTDEHMRKLQLAVNMVSLPEPNSGGPLIDASVKFSKKRYDHEFRWQPSPEVAAAIVRAIFSKKESPLRLV